VSRISSAVLVRMNGFGFRLQDLGPVAVQRIDAGGAAGSGSCPRLRGTAHCGSRRGHLW